MENHGMSHQEGIRIYSVCSLVRQYWGECKKAGIYSILGVITKGNNFLNGYLNKSYLWNEHTERKIQLLVNE